MKRKTGTLDALDPGSAFVDIGNSSASNSETTIETGDVSITVLGFGIKGDAGPPGEQGADGGDKTYKHTQSIPSAEWTINHNLNKYPAVTVVDSGGSLVDGDVLYVDENNVTVRFAGGFSGEAHLN